MTFDPARPRYTLSLAGKEYDLIGTMEVVENIEFQLKKSIGRVAVEVTEEMPTHELARLLSAILCKCGQDVSVQDARDLLWNKVGLSGDGMIVLRLNLYGFLSICLAPPEAREKKAKEAGELQGKLESLAASLGDVTKKSASARSAGNRRNSGKQRPGM